MDAYAVVITPEAADNLQEIKYYISYSLKSPQTAGKYIRSVRKQIEGLEVFPSARSLVQEEPWRSRGVRRIIHKNFYIYFRIDEANKTVYILNVIYAKRDQLKAMHS